MNYNYNYQVDTELFSDVVSFFDKREEIISLYALIFNNLVRQRKFQDEGYGFTTEDLISVCFFILSYISEGYYLNLKLTIKDIQLQVALYYDYRFQIELEEEIIQRLTEYLVVNILQNNGVPYEYPIYSFERKESRKSAVRLIIDKRMERKAGVRSDSESMIYYALTSQGYQLLFSTKEIQDETQVSIEQMKISFALTRGRYDRALKHAKEACRAVKQQWSEMDDFIINAKKGYSHVSINEYIALYQDLVETLSEQKNDAIIISEQVNGLREDIVDKVDEKTLKDLSLLNAVAIELKVLLALHQDLILKYHELQQVYSEVLHTGPLFNIVQTLSLETDVLEKMEYNIEAGYKVSDLLKYFVKPKIHQFFTPHTPFRLQASLKGSMLGEEEDSIIDLMEHRSDQLSSKLEKERIKEQQQLMREIVETFIIKLTQSNSMEFELRDWLAELEESDDESIAKWFNTPLFSYVLLNLYNNLQNLMLNELKGKSDNYKAISEVAPVIDFKVAVVQLLEKKPELFKGMIKLNAYRVEDTEHELVEYAYINYDEFNRRVLHEMMVSNLRFKGGIEE